MFIKKKHLDSLKKLLSLYLAAWMIIGMLPLTAFADNISDWAKTTSQTIIQGYGEGTKKDWWEIFALALNQAGRPSDEIFVHNQVIDSSGEVIQDNEILSKSILTLRALGYDPTNYYGRDLVSLLGEMAMPQDIKGISLRLAALSSDYYGYPSIQEKVNELIVSLLTKQQENIWYEDTEENWQEPTGWALYALSFFYRQVKESSGEFEQVWPEVNSLLQEADIARIIEGVVYERIEAKQEEMEDISEGSLRKIVLLAGAVPSCSFDFISEKADQEKSLLDILKRYEHPGFKGGFKTILSDSDPRTMATGENKGLVLSALTANGVSLESRTSVFDLRFIEKDKALKPQIDQLEKIGDVEVPTGTAFEALKLPSKVRALLTDKTQIDLSDIRWDRSEPIYDPMTPGEYIFEGSYTLPEELEGHRPKLICKVIVKESAAEDEKTAWAKEKMLMIADYYASLDKTSDWWAIAQMGKLGKEIKPGDLEFLYRETFPDGKLTTKPFIGKQGVLLKGILALRATGYDPENYYGYNLVEELCKEKLDAEGSNIWHITSALFALSSDEYTYSGLQAKRDELIQTILSFQKEGGLWGSTEWGWQDETGFALYALAPYYSRPEVKERVQKAVEAISSKQLENGGITADPGNSNSLSMVAGGLWSCDPNLLNDPRLVKNGRTMLDELKAYDVEGKHEFLWKKGSDTGKPMATEQAFRALVAYFSMKEGKGYIFNNSDKPKNIATDKYIDKIDLPWRKSVAFGTLHTEVLPKTAVAKISGGETQNIDLTWDNGMPSYDPQTSGTYVFTATYSRPEGVAGSLPRAQMRIFVEEKKDDTQEVLEWAEQKMNLIADSYAEKQKLDDWWKIAEIGRLGKAITPDNMEFLFRNTFVNGKLSEDVGVLLKGTLAIRAAGYDPENYYGHNIVEALVNAPATRGMWDMAPKVWALASDDYEQTDADGEIRNLLQEILSQQSSDGLWGSEWGWEDSTGFALYALAPYYEEDIFGLGIKEAVEKAVNAISKQQQSNGDIKPPPGNSNSLAMVAGGLWSCDPKYLTDARLVKNGKTLLHALKLYDVPNQPDFLWKTDDTSSNSMATEQAFRSLITLSMKRANKGYVFDYRGLPKEVLKQEITVDRVEQLEDIRVSFGTERESLTLPTQATLILSNGESRAADLTWGDSRPSYDANKAGDYVFEAQYSLPSEISGAKPTIRVKVIVEDIPTVLKSIAPVAAEFEVIKGTSEDEAKLKLPKETIILDSKDQYHTVGLEWTIEGYNPDAIGSYPAIGVFHLPSEVGQSDPAQELKVGTIVKVVEDPNAPPAINNDALRELVERIEAEGLDKNQYTAESFESLERALQKARELLADNTAQQEAVNEALLTLQNARNQLQSKANKQQLGTSIDRAKALLEAKALYEAAGVARLEEELAKSERLYESPNAGQQEVDLQTEALNAACEALRKKNEGGGSGGGGGGGVAPPSDDISVFFTLKSIERKGTKEEIWVPRQAVTVPKGSKVYAPFDMMMKKYGLEYINKGNYISEIRSPIDGEWFGEFSNGKYSGWMYTVNGKHPMFGLEEFTIYDKDEIVWHYTNDYRYEEGSEKWINENFGIGSSVEGDTKAKIDVQGGIGKVESTDKLKKMLELSIDEVRNLSADKRIVSIDLRDEKSLQGFEVGLSREIFSKITTEDKLRFAIKSNVIELVVDENALQEIQKMQDKTSGEVRFEAKTIEKASSIPTNKAKEVGELIGARPGLEVNIKVNGRVLSEYPNGKLTLKIPYTLKKGEDKNQLTVYRIEKDELIEMSDVRFDEKDNVVVFSTDHLSYYAVGLKANPIPENEIPLASLTKFKDVPDTAWYAKAVHAMAERGLIRGKQEGMYMPSDRISRAELVAILARIDNIDIEKAEGARFRDVKPGSWYYRSISWAFENNIAKGYGEDFRPNEPISREEIAAILLNYSRYNNGIKLSEQVAEKQFADQNKIAPWAMESVKIMQKAGIVGGKQNNLFEAKSYATRAEVAEMIYRMIG